MGASTANKTTNRRQKAWLAALVAVALAAVGIGAGLHLQQSAYAKTIGNKNETAKQACEGTAPYWTDTNMSGSNEKSPTSTEGYTSTGNANEYYYKHPTDGTNGTVITGVWTGGNAHSANTSIGSWTDSDINDFQSVLPFGTIYPLFRSSVI